MPKRIRFTVASIGDAKSLEGGVLLQTPLYGADGNVYAVAQGNVSIGGNDVKVSANLQSKYKVVGYIPSGAIVEKEIPTQEILPYVQLGCLICPDYTGIFSDISAGLSEVHLGYTVLIARNENAVKIIQEAEKAGYIETKPGTLDIVEEVKFRAETKLIRAMKYASMLL